TYGELGRRVAGLAKELRERTNRGGRVAVVTRKAPGTVVAMLAALHAGRSYVPVDPAVPQRRRDFMLTQAACELVLADVASVDLSGVDLPVVDLGDAARREASADEVMGGPLTRP